MASGTGAYRVSEEGAQHNGSLNILLAEDDPTNQMITLLMLRKLGHDADLAGNGYEVLTALEYRSYDLVLMDIQMPEMDGIEATRIIRKRWPLGPRIVFVTACTYCKETCMILRGSNFITRVTSTGVKRVRNTFGTTH
jgi:CheY-like chemotaxis protein